MDAEARNAGTLARSNGIHSTDATPRRVLFVDDEAEVLEGLKPLLRRYRRHWEVAFANSGPEALQILEGRPFDAVVADLRMPKMDGHAFLTTLRERWPQTVRILMSAHVKQEAVVRSAAVSHQFLGKPCEFGALIASVERACRLESLLEAPELRKLVGEIGELPAVPEIYRELTAALAREEVDLQAVGSIVERDPGIAAKVLQLVNSSFVGVARALVSIRDAAVYLGTNVLRDMVLHLSAYRQFEPGAKSQEAAMAREQGHSLLAARIARRIAPDKAGGTSAFMAGMLHDIGKLVLMTKRPVEYAEIVEQARSAGRPLNEVETERLGVSHAEIGAYLLGLWGLPYSVVEAVASHHAPSRVPDQSGFGSVGAVHVGQCLAAELSEDESTARLDEDYLERLGVKERLPKWQAAVAEGDL